MSTPNDGGSAFPYGDNDSPAAPFNPGMTMRDYFAGQALAGLLASGHFTHSAAESGEDEPAVIRVFSPVLDKNGENTGRTKAHLLVIEEAAFLADAMLEELRNKEGG